MRGLELDIHKDIHKTSTKTTSVSKIAVPSVFLNHSPSKCGVGARGARVLHERGDRGGSRGGDRYDDRYRDRDRRGSDRDRDRDRRDRR